jgi:membrane protein
MWQQVRAYVERWLFAASDGRDARTQARLLAQYPYALLRDLLGGQLNMRATGLVYATLLALIPLVALSFAILRVFGVHRELEPLIFEFFRPMGAGAAELTRKVMAFADHVRGGLVGSVGLGLLIWTLMGTLKKVEDSLNFVWHVEVPRGFMRRVAEYLALLTIAPLVIGALIAMTQMPYVQSSVRVLSRVPLLSQLLSGVVALAPLVIIGSAFALVYALIPNTRVRALPALIGGLVAGMIWAAIGRVFATLVVLSSNLTIVYAGFAIFVAALIWIYFGWVILLLGAQLSFYVQNPSYLRIGLHEPRLSSAETEQLALSLMYLVADSHLRGGEPWTVNALAARLRLPGVTITRLVAALEAMGLLATTSSETLLPGRDAMRISLQEIVLAARNANSLHGEGRASAPPVVARVCAEMESAWRARVGGRSLAALVLEVDVAAASRLFPGNGQVADKH